MSGPRVLLIAAPAFRRGSLRSVFPIGLYSLRTVASAAGFAEVDILDLVDELGNPAMTSPDIADAILDRFEPRDYEIIGLSTVGGVMTILLFLVQRIKERNPMVTVVLGGPQASFLAAETLRDFPAVDAVVIGEGEVTFVEMLRAFRRSHDDWRGIPGVMVRGTPFVKRDLIGVLDSLPLPEYDAGLCLRDSAEYLRIEALRGCYAGCRFCSTTQFWERKVRRKSPARLAEGMLHLSNLTGLSRFLFVGDNFSFPARTFRETCRYLIEANTGLSWGCALRIGDLEREDLLLLKEAGCFHLFVGVESASQETLDRIDKRVQIDKTCRMMEEALGMGLEIGASQIVGFPWEDEEDILATLRQHDRFLDLGISSRLVALMPSPGASGFPGSPLVMEMNRIESLLPPYCRDDFSRDLIHRYPHHFIQFGYYDTPHLRRTFIDSVVEAADHLEAIKQLRRRTPRDPGEP